MYRPTLDDSKLSSYEVIEANAVPASYASAQGMVNQISVNPELATSVARGKAQGLATILALAEAVRQKGAAWYWQQRFAQANNQRLALIEQLEACQNPPEGE